MTAVFSLLSAQIPLARLSLPSQTVQVSMAGTDEERLRKIVVSHGSFVTRTLRNLGVNGGELDDCVQKVFIVAARRLSDIERGKERAFLFRCAQNTASHYRRTLARKREVSDDELALHYDPEERPDVISERKHYRLLLDQILDQMDETLRTVLVLHAFEEMTMAAIAECLEIPPGTVASRLRRARAAFKHELLNIEAKSGKVTA